MEEVGVQGMDSGISSRQAGGGGLTSDGRRGDGHNSVDFLFVLSQEVTRLQFHHAHVASERQSAQTLLLQSVDVGDDCLVLVDDDAVHLEHVSP